MRRHWPLLPIAALALALRLVSLDFGLPGHPHPDEWRVVRPAVRMARSPDADLHPGYFNYPTGTDGQTVCELPPGPDNSANCDRVVGAPNGDLTNVGAYTSSWSPWGTFD